MVNIKNIYSPPLILEKFDNLDKKSNIIIFGAGETGQEFAKKLNSIRSDVNIVCFIDSYREGEWNNIPILKPDYLKNIEENVTLIIASVFWSEIAEYIDNKYRSNYMILSNNLINQASHLSSYGSFYFGKNLTDELENRFCLIKNSFSSDYDVEIFRKLFDLRVYEKEEEFFTFVNRLTALQKTSFETQDKYSRHLDFDSIDYVIEGGVYDGCDTYRFLEVLKKSPNFKKVFAFDPFLDSFKNGKYFKKIDPSLCEFFEKVLWDCEERVAFQIDGANPANSKVLRESEMGSEMITYKMHPTVMIDSFLHNRDIPVHLIKLDVEGAEINVLNGARDSILRWRPKMAISIYHRKEHLLEIPELLLSLHNDYKFTLSVNNPSFVDMVLYAT